MLGAIVGHAHNPVLPWEIQFTSNNFNKIFESDDWEGFCAQHIPDDRLQLAMNHAQTCGMIEVGRYQDAVQAAKSQGMKENIDFPIVSTSNNLVMSHFDRFKFSTEDRRKHLMILLAQAREQKMAKDELRRLTREHALRRIQGGNHSA